MKRKYVIDGLDEEFSSLRKAKDHFWGYSDKDKEEMNGIIITGYKGDEIVSCYEYRFVNKKSRFTPLKA